MQDDRATAASSQLACAVSYPMPLTSSSAMTMQRRRPRYAPVSHVRVFQFIVALGSCSFAHLVQHGENCSGGVPAARSAPVQDSSFKREH